MTKSIIKLVLPLFIASTLLTSCGGANQQSEESKETESSETSSQQQTGKVKVVFYHTFGQKILEALEKRKAKFEELVKKNEGVDVEVVLDYQGGYDDMVEKVTMGFSSGDSPSMAVAYPDHISDYFAFEEKNKMEAVVNLDTFINDKNLTFGTDRYLDDTEDVDDIIPAFLDEGRQFKREGTYVLPFMKSSEVMIYNLDAAKRAMKFYDPSVLEGKVEETINKMTWDELLEFGKVAYEHKEDVASELDYSIYYDSDSNLFISKMYQNEIPYSSIDESGKGVIDFETGENLANAKELVKSLRVAHDNHAFTTKGTEGTYASNSFQQQECIFTIGSSGGAGYTFPQAGAFDYVVTAVPASNDNPLYISQGPSIALFNRPELTKEENRLSVLYSWKFAKYITSTNINVELCVRGSEGYVPVRESSYATESFLEFLEYGEMYATTARILSDVIDGHYLNTAVFKGSATLRTQVGAIISSVLGNKKIGTEITMEEAIDNAFSTAINAAKLDF